MPEAKRKRGRPKSRDTSSFSGRTDRILVDAMFDLSAITGLSVSRMAGAFVLNVVLDGEAELRKHGKWTPALDRFKRQKKVA